MTLRAAPYNCIDFSNDRDRGEKYFKPSLQRRKNYLSVNAGMIFFEYIPAAMPEYVPSMTIGLAIPGFSGPDFETYSIQDAIELTDRFIYSINLSALDFFADVSVMFDFIVLAQVDDVPEKTYYSEICRFIPAEIANENSIVSILAYNNDSRHGYFDSSHPICGFFEFSEFNCRVFGNEKVEYKYSYGGSKILSSENYIKTRLTFVNLTMYQQNLLKWLCNCENLTIDGVGYQLISDFTEKNKDELNEICDLQAEFVRVDQSQFATASENAANRITPINLFSK